MLDCFAFKLEMLDTCEFIENHNLNNFFIKKAKFNIVFSCQTTKINNYNLYGVVLSSTTPFCFSRKG